LPVKEFFIRTYEPKGKDLTGRWRGYTLKNSEEPMVAMCSTCGGKACKFLVYRKYKREEKIWDS
jgi:hypothetical protein